MDPDEARVKGDEIQQFYMGFDRDPVINRNHILILRIIEIKERNRRSNIVGVSHIRRIKNGYYS
jgi:hypothetical protein